MCLKERSKNYEWKEKRKIEQNKQNKNVLSKGVEEKKQTWYFAREDKSKQNKKTKKKRRIRRKGFLGKKQKISQIAGHGFL